MRVRDARERRKQHAPQRERLCAQLVFRFCDGERPASHCRDDDTEGAEQSSVPGLRKRDKPDKVNKASLSVRPQQNKFDHSASRHLDARVAVRRTR